MAIVIAFFAPVAVACVVGGVKSFVKHCKEDSRGVQAVFNK